MRFDDRTRVCDCNILIPRYWRMFVTDNGFALIQINTWSPTATTFFVWNLKPFDSFFVGSFQVSACLALWESEAHLQLVRMEMKRTSGTDWMLFCCFVVCLFVEPRLGVGATLQVLTNSITNNPLIVIHSSLPSHPHILIRNLTLNLIGGDRERRVVIAAGVDRKYFK